MSPPPTASLGTSTGLVEVLPQTLQGLPDPVRVAGRGRKVAKPVSLVVQEEPEHDLTLITGGMRTGGKILSPGGGFKTASGNVDFLRFISQ